jgi:hypothetical protein
LCPSCIFDIYKIKITQKGIKTYRAIQKDETILRGSTSFFKNLYISYTPDNCSKYNSIFEKNDNDDAYELKASDKVNRNTLIRIDKAQVQAEVLPPDNNKQKTNKSTFKPKVRDNFHFIKNYWCE